MCWWIAWFPSGANVFIGIGDLLCAVCFNARAVALLVNALVFFRVSVVCAGVFPHVGECGLL